MFDFSKLFQNQQVLSPLQMSLWEWGFVIVGLSLTIWLIFWLRSYYREDADDKDEALEMLTQFRNLHQEGGLSDDEFRLIRSRLTHSTHKVLAAETTKTDAISASINRPKLTDSETKKTELQSPVIDPPVGDEVKSERMPDEKTE